jgi:hypothetical protein
MAADVIGRNFTQIFNGALRDKNLSRRARGLLAELLTHSDGFGISVSRLTDAGPEGRDAINDALNELERHGYLVRARVQDDETGRYGGVEYLMTDMPNGFTVTGSLDEEMSRPPASEEKRGLGKNPGQSSDADFQAADYQEQVFQGLASGTHKKTKEEKTNQEKNTLGAAAPGESEPGVSSEDLEKRIAELCGRLADLVKGNSGRRPKITYAWRDAARDLLTGEDPYSFDQVWDGIQWAQADTFWASRTTTMAKLAKHFDQIIIQARMRSRDTSTPQGKQEQNAVVGRRMKAMGEFMAAFEQKYGRPMDDKEQKALLARLKEEVQ